MADSYFHRAGDGDRIPMRSRDSDFERHTVHAIYWLKRDGDTPNSVHGMGNFDLDSLKHTMIPSMTNRSGKSIKLTELAEMS